MKTILLTGGAGFFGGILKKRLLDDAFAVVSLDIVPDETTAPNLTSLTVDLRDKAALEQVFASNRFDGVMHCAAMLAHAIKDKNALWQSNVEGTRNVADLAAKHKVPAVVFTSSNCLWAKNFHRPVREDDVPDPQELYGRSKWEGEKIIASHASDFRGIVIRTPTIIDFGRLGLLAILYEFIDEGRKVWAVGGGRNRYQFIYAPDLADACVRALGHGASDVFNVGSDNVKTIREVFQYVCDKAGTGARVASLPKRTTTFLMRLAHVLKLSPLGTYHYKMIAEDFEFDTSKIKNALGWRPTLTDEEMLYRAYLYYHEHLQEIRSRTAVSAHKQAAKMGIIKILKWMS